MAPKSHDSGAVLTQRGLNLSWPVLCGMIGIPLGSVGVYHQYNVGPEQTATDVRLKAVEGIAQDVTFLKAQAEFNSKALARIEDEQRDERKMLLFLANANRPR